MAERRILIVGGGAAGVFAALRLKELRPGWAVTILEASGKPLAKVRISGGGRCNVTHACYEVDQLLGHYPRGGRELGRLLQRFGPAETVQWFQARGVRLKTEADGRMFPTTDDSATIIDCFTRRAEELGVRWFLGHRVVGMEPSWKVHLKGRTLEADGVLLATGSGPLGYELLNNLGHKVIPPAPSLFTFQVEDARIAGLAGISLGRVRVGLGKLFCQEGPLLITHHGLSGPAVLKLSAFAARHLQELHYQTTFWVDLLPEHSHDQVLNILQSRKNGSKKTAAGDDPFSLPKRLWQRLLEFEGIDGKRRWSELANKSLNRLGEHLKRAEFQMRGKATFKEEFVTAGGLPLSELHLDRLESRRRAGLFVAGELLDVDGVTGGFNFQNCWASAWVAAEGLAKL